MKDRTQWSNYKTGGPRLAASNPKRNTTERPWPKVKTLLIYKLSRRLWRKKNL